MVEMPRYVINKKLAGGKTAYYFNVPGKYLKLGCKVENEALGTDYAEMKRKAEIKNQEFDEWLAKKSGLTIEGPRAPRFGTVDWLFREYKSSLAYTEKVAQRSRQSYEWAMREVCDTLTKRGDRVGGRAIKTISPAGADKLYAKFITKDDGSERLRVGEKLTVLCRKAWRVVHRLHPECFDEKVPNPWTGVTMKTRVKAIKPAATREDVYQFAAACVENEEIECAAIAVICFEWLQRPENVIAGHIKWNGYRNPRPTIRIEHHKTGAIIDHPLEEVLEDGTVVKFYEEAEAVLAKLPRRGIPMVLRAVDKDTSKPFSFSGMQKIVQRMRAKAGLSSEFTLDACRHGGMTELEEAELTEGQGRALSAHRTKESYAGYAKRTAKRMLSATRKRHAHTIANKLATDVQNDTGKSVQNDAAKKAG